MLCELLYNSLLQSLLHDPKELKREQKRRAREEKLAQKEAKRREKLDKKKKVKGTNAEPEDDIDIFPEDE